MASHQKQSGIGGYVAVAAIGLVVGRWSASSPEPVRSRNAAPVAAVSEGWTETSAQDDTMDRKPATDQDSTKDDELNAQPYQRVEPAEVYYARCADARAAGAAPIHEGEPGYAPRLDRDGDGVACE